jgi:HK97 family phage major capsid protein
MDFSKIMAAAQSAMQLLLDKAKAESRVFTAEETADFDKQQKAFNDAKAMNDREVAVAAQNAAASQPVNQPAHRVEVVNGPKWKGGFGEFLGAVARAAIDPRNADPRLVLNASGLNVNVPSEGGVLVEPEMAKSVLARTYESSAIASRCTKYPVGPNSNEVSFNYINETSRATGSRMGGVRGYWIPESGTVTASQPSLAKLTIRLKKLAGLLYATEEMMQDTTFLGSFMGDAFAQEFAWLLDMAILSGTGAGEPLGWNKSAAKVSVSKESGQAASTIVFENIVKMWARMWGRSRSNAVWFINQDVEPQLQTMAYRVGTSAVPVYLPAGGVSGTPYSTLYGRPIVPIEQAETVGTTGDIVLADMSQYQLIDKGGIRTDESIHVSFLTDERAFRFIYRVGGSPMWTSALTPAKGSNTLSPFVVLDTRA